MQKNKLCIDCKQKEAADDRRTCLQCRYINRRKIREKMLADSIIPYCDNHPDVHSGISSWLSTGNRCCGPCLYKQRKESYEKRLANGLVPCCKNHPTRASIITSVLCSQCEKARGKEVRRNLVASGFVPYCKNHPNKAVTSWIAHGRFRCRSCLNKTSYRINLHKRHVKSGLVALRSKYRRSKRKIRENKI